MPRYHDLEKVQQNADFFAQLCDLFLPIVRSIIASKLAETTKGMRVLNTTDKESLVADIVKKVENEGMTAQEKVQFESAIEQTFEQEPEPQDWEIKEASMVATSMLVSTWCGVLRQACKASGQIVASSLDNFMWPIGQAKEIKFLENTWLTIDDSRSILRAVKQSLPTGKDLPSILIEYLALNGVNII